MFGYMENNIDFWGMANKNENSVGRPRLFDTPEQMQKAIDDYFKNGVNTRPVAIGKEIIKMPVPTITGLVLHIGFCDRASFYDYEKYPEFSYTIKRARAFIEQHYEELLQAGNTTGAIFALKNFGWKDERTTEHKGGVTVGSPLDNIRTKLNIGKDVGADK